MENVLGGDLEPCSTDPETGYERDGNCAHHPRDLGRHEICAVMTEEFLTYSQAQGNDLITPRPELNFPGLEPGDRWCVCIDRWVEAAEADAAPPVVLAATNRTVLERIPRSTLEAHAYRGGNGDGEGDDGDGRPDADDEHEDDGRGNDADPPF